MNTSFSTFVFLLLSGFLLILSSQYLRYTILNKNHLILLLSSTIFGTAGFLAIIYIWEFIKGFYFVIHNICWFTPLNVLYNLPNFLLEPTASLGDSKSIAPASIALFIASCIYFTYSLKIDNKNKKEAQIKGKKAPSNHFQTSQELDFFKKRGAIENTITRSIEKAKPVILTLKSRKVYIGTIIRIPTIDLLPIEESISILPTYSGYRKDDDLLVKINNDYSHFYDMYKELKEELGDVDIENLHDIEIFYEYKKDSKKQPLTISAPELEKMIKDLVISVFWNNIETVAIWNGEILGGFQQE